MRRGNSQVIMRGEHLLDLCDSRLREAHKQMRLVLAAVGKRNFGAGSRSPLAIGSVGSSMESTFTPYKRASRGTLSKGPARSVGRLKFGKEKMSDAERQRLSRARGRLRNIVRALRQWQPRQA